MQGEYGLNKPKRKKKQDGKPFLALPFSFATHLSPEDCRRRLQPNIPVFLALGGGGKAFLHPFFQMQSPDVWYFHMKTNIEGFGGDVFSLVQVEGYLSRNIEIGSTFVGFAYDKRFVFWILVSLPFYLAFLFFVMHDYPQTIICLPVIVLWLVGNLLIMRQREIKLVNAIKAILEVDMPKTKRTSEESS